MKFIFDLDGTICFKGQPISNNILNSLSEVTSQGHEVIFASARPIRDMLPVIDMEFHNYTMIGGNGSLIYKNKELIKSKSFSEEVVCKVKELIKKFNATYLIDGEWNYAYTGPNNHPILQNVDPTKLASLVSIDRLNPIIKILFLTSNNSTELEKELNKLNVFINKHSNENILDISPKGVNKWHALNELGVPENNYIAFGNDSNDIPMFEKALHTVMIGDHKGLAPYANDVINNERELEQAIVNKIKELSSEYSINQMN
ncbi:HAD-IIB family hydrolase [Filobacillus milosensis]|uniref:HAD-IIB family hydrolase n=1 Tax=Filobacillus milosensis TaxID=94137 RepID=A0A4Y8IVB1_9BACI|nr:HAD-IIB family hydrolase [Filobacillus milosensis]TFB25089.1 HAD-IIB family hydrolase [Filobacillus milosensis]